MSVDKRPRVLIEDFLAIDIIGSEAAREGAASSALPPMRYLHVWWSRKPLVVCRAAILASLLPSWSPDWSEDLQKQFPSEDAYHDWFLHACGILGDPVKGRKLIQWAKDQGGIKLKESPYGYARAFTVSPGLEVIDTIQRLTELTWGKQVPKVLDSFAGGGSIPFEGLRYGFSVMANELNSVASVILKATIEYPFRYGEDLAKDIKKYGSDLCARVKQRLQPFFPVQTGESVHAFLWARTVRCPYTGKPVPLSPNWWLQTGTNPVAAVPHFDEKLPAARFEIVRGKDACAKARPDRGTIKGGDAISGWAQDQPIDGDYIKAEAQAGRMGAQLYAMAVKKSRGLEFREPTREDVEAVRAAEHELERLMPAWEAKGIVPNTPVPDGNKTSEPRRYGIMDWRDMFSPRQFLSLCTYVEELVETKKRLFAELPEERARAVATYLGILLDKAADYNCILSTWENSKRVVKHLFQMHNFSFKYNPGEFDSASNLFPWALGQVLDAYSGLVHLALGEANLFDDDSQPMPVQIFKGNAAVLHSVSSKSFELACVDPPFFESLMYSECSDFFYVWMKRTLGDVFPEWFRDELTNKDDEAVANQARFAGISRGKKDLAKADYERKMAQCFGELHRVLRDDGVLTVMFTHKQVEAWDSLAMSLLTSGFEIRSSWPVHTENENSLHQAKKNAVNSAILLTCRKRSASSESVWWDDIKGEVRRTARQKAEEFQKQGITGVDLYISTFGPTLSILSRHWPVLTSEVDENTGREKPLRPETALDLAREEVVALRKQWLLLGRNVQFDPATDWYLMAWDAFKAAEFPADEARKLALALGLDLDREIISARGLAKKKASSVVLAEPWDRRKRGMVDPDLKAFDSMLDAAHTAMLLYHDEGAPSCLSFLNRTVLLGDGSFRQLIQAMISAIPRTRSGKGFARPEADVLEAMRLAFFDDLEVPPEEAPPIDGEQLSMAGLHEGDSSGDEDDGGDEDD
jgi:putative DNA methylase